MLIILYVATILDKIIWDKARAFVYVALLSNYV